MAQPFVHNPAPSSYPAFQTSNYYDSLIYGGNKYSPFIPPTPLPGTLPGLYSPFGAALNTPLPPSPHLGAIPFPTSGGVSTDWTGYPTRQRTLSWHGAAAPAAYSPGFLTAALPPSHHRSSSFGAQTAWPPQWPTAPLIPTQIPMSLLQYRLHPWLNGETPRADFRFDVSSPYCAPQRLNSSGMWVVLGANELVAQATNPGVTKLRIVCDLLPQWPIELQPVTGMSSLNPLPPLLLQDVLLMLHQSLQTRISYSDWAKLNPVQETLITRAFTQRCAAFGPMANEERKKGVRRVDFLIGKVWFRGLVPTTEPGVLKMILG